MGLFIDHVNTVLHKLRETPITSLSTDTSTEAYNAQEAVRRAVARIWNAKQWVFKLRRYTFATASGTEAYIVPRLMGEIYSINSPQAPYLLTSVKEDTFDRAVPNPTATGNPSYARLFEVVGVDTQPSSASIITLVSSDGTDTTQKVLVKGLVGGYLDYEQVSLNGTTSAVTSKSFSAVYALTKSDTTAGYVTATSNAGVVTNGVLAPQDKTLRLRKIRLYPIPSSTLTITVKGYGVPPLMTHAYEDAEIPVRWDYVVDQFAYGLALQYKGQEQLAEFDKQMAVAIKFLEDDMVTEENIAAEDIIIPERFGGSDCSDMPEGYVYPY